MEEEADKVDHGEMLGAWVRRRRHALGITAEAVVGRMGPGVPQNYVTQLENGGRKGLIAQPRLGQLARALGASEIDLLRGAGAITESMSDGDRDDDPDDDDLLAELEQRDAIAGRAASLVLRADPRERDDVRDYLDYLAYRIERRERGEPAVRRSGEGRGRRPAAVGAGARAVADG